MIWRNIWNKKESLDFRILIVTNKKYYYNEKSVIINLLSHLYW